MEHGTIDIPPHYASGVGDSARSDIPSELWRGELGYLAAISPTVHRLALELIDRQARALAAVISDTTAVRPEIARLHGIALAGVFEIIISEAGRRTRDGQSQTKSLGSYRESSTIFSKNSTTGSAYRSHHAASRRGAVGRELTDLTVRAKRHAASLIGVTLHPHALTYSSLRNASTVSPASRTMPPIGYALTGFCRGIVRMRTPSVITMCFPCRTTPNPAFSSARTASR